MSGAFIRIARPGNSFAVGVLALAACLAAGAGRGLASSVVMAVLGSSLVAAGGYVLNDLFDYETDKLTHPARVLPKGEMDRGTARTYALVSLIGAPLLFLFVNPLSFANASLAALLLALYSWKLKSRIGALGNFVVALLASNSALIGGFVVGELGRVIPLAVCVFFATLAREIVKDIQDLPGDSATRTQTVPMLIGRSRASHLAALFLGLAIPAAYLPYQRAIFGLAYLIAASVVNVAVLYTAVRLALSGGKRAGLIQQLIKAEMFLYILIFLLAALFNVVQTG
jgi:geranylgeranylglycerol-phosphate geranylgeranyltransferase